MLTNSEINYLILLIRLRHRHDLGVLDDGRTLSTDDFWGNVASKETHFGVFLEKKLIRLYNSGSVREML